jgi:hypothetical protein
MGSFRAGAGLAHDFTTFRLCGFFQTIVPFDTIDYNASPYRSRASLARSYRLIESAGATTTGQGVAAGRSHRRGRCDPVRRVPPVNQGSRVILGIRRETFEDAAFADSDCRNSK